MTTAVEHAFRLQPCWQSTVRPGAPTESPALRSVDVAVVGAGITGLCAARALALRGIDVAVFEAQTAGWGASSRNGGMVLTGLKLGASTLISRYGLDRARRMFSMALDAVDAVERVAATEAIDCDFERCGHVALASKPAHYGHYERAAELLGAKFSHAVQPIPRADLGREIGSALYHGGLLDPISASVNPARYVDGLARAVRRLSVPIHERTPVTRIERHGGQWRVTTANGAIEARNVVVATSGYTGRVTEVLRRKIVPIGSYVIATEPLPEALARQLSPRRRMFYDSRHFLHYFRLTPDRRVLFGGRARFVPETASTVAESAAVLRRAMLETYPELSAASVDYAWGGTLDFAFDTMPHAGVVDGVHFAYGYAGHGVALATYLGTQVGDAVGRDAALSIPFSDIPFPGAPLGLDWGRPGFLPLVAAWYRLLDWVG